MSIDYKLSQEGILNWTKLRRRPQFLSLERGNACSIHKEHGTAALCPEKSEKVDPITVDLILFFRVSLSQTSISVLLFPLIKLFTGIYLSKIIAPF